MTSWKTWDNCWDFSKGWRAFMLCRVRNLKAKFSFTNKPDQTLLVCQLISFKTPEIHNWQTIFNWSAFVSRDRRNNKAHRLEKHLQTCQLIEVGNDSESGQVSETHHHSQTGHSLQVWSTENSLYLGWNVGGRGRGDSEQGEIHADTLGGAWGRHGLLRVQSEARDILRVSPHKLLSLSVQQQVGWEGHKLT